MMSGVSEETRMSLQASSMFPGFRFSPTDVELISYYLKKKMESADTCVEVIPEVEICKHEPWDLPGKSVIQSENEWFFFSARGRKYPNGSQSKRATELGYWKATGKERNVKSGSDVIGTKRTLVFHVGRAPKGERTEWIMHEYSMKGNSQDSMVVCRLRRNVEFRSNDTPSRASLNESPLSNAQSSGNAASESVIDRTGVSEGEKAECSKKCSSGNDSFSIEQLDPASECEQKQSDGITLAESSILQKDFDSEDDFYADILKDDIVKLDETSSLNIPGFLAVASRPAIENSFQHLFSQTLPTPASPFLGAANRRVNLKKPALAEAFKKVDSGQKGKEKERPHNSPKCVFSALSRQFGTGGLISVVSVIMVVLVLLVSLLGGSQQVKRIAYATIYKLSPH
ncbi:hypothetical protein K2173_014185 [Erythroxylum novogranatense]|uniref:NAC domain-containing protein n=1 Tax=Erythroxylum novogranatense TaxID=1862640 RepID=A0AAV8SEA3_9ROSI|nr:hypothetical protein K2173_014185 [Erythroxylum novogranatense]